MRLSLRSPEATVRKFAPIMKKSHSSKPPVSGLAAFTLIELLVVISIIAILATFALSAGKGAIKSAYKASARNDMGSIMVVGLKCYYTDYGKYPTPTTESVDVTYGKGGTYPNSVLFNAMRYADSNMTQAAKDMNPRETRYMEVAKAKNTKSPISGLDDSGNWYDPWGEQYVVFIDGDYDGKITVKPVFSSGIGGTSTDDQGKVAVSVGAASVGYGTKIASPKTPIPGKFDKANHVVSWQ